MTRKQKARKVLALLDEYQLEALERLLNRVPESRRGRFLECFLGTIYDLSREYRHTLTGGAIGGLIGFLIDSAIHIPFTNIHPTGWTLTLLGAAWGAFQGYQLDIQEQRIAKTVFQRLLAVIVEGLCEQDDGEEAQVCYAKA